VTPAIFYTLPSLRITEIYGARDQHTPTNKRPSLFIQPFLMKNCSLKFQILFCWGELE